MQESQTFSKIDTSKPFRYRLVRDDSGEIEYYYRRGNRYFFRNKYLCFSMKLPQNIVEQFKGYKKFSRFVFEALGRDGEAKEQFKGEFRTKGRKLANETV